MNPSTQSISRRNGGASTLVHARLLWAGGLIVVLALTTQSAALERCRVRADRKDGTLSFNVTGVVGALHWGNRATDCSNAVHDPLCVAVGKATKCTLAEPGTLEARTAPYDCTLDLCDDADQIECYIKGCTVRSEPPLCGAGEVLTWDGFEFQCVADDAGGGGTVSTVNTGAGLSGGPITTAGTIQINAIPCSGTDKLTWNGSAFFCQSDHQGVTMITSGPGLMGGTITSTGSLAVNAPHCSSFEKLEFLAGSGFQCVLDPDTTYTAGNQLTLTGTTFAVREGSGSGLDADLLDGLTSTAFAAATHTHSLTCSTVSHTASGVLSAGTTCPFGRLVTGGGGSCEGAAGSRIAISQSVPVGTTGWAVACETTAANLLVSAVCCEVD